MKGISMRHGMKIVLLSALCAAVCSSATSAQTTLRYKFTEGEKLQYVVEKKTRTTSSVMNMETESKMNLSMDLVWQVISVKGDGSAQVQFKVTYAKISMGMVEVDSAQKNTPDEPIAKAASQMVKARAAIDMTGTLLATGEVKDVKVSEKTIEAMKKLPGGETFDPDSLKSMVSSFVFPTEAVAKGKTWSSKSEVKTPIFTTIAENIYTYDGAVQKEGATLEKISIKPELKIEPAPKSPIKEVKEVKGSGQLFFDNKAGHIIEAVVNQNMRLELTFGGTDIIQATEQITTIRLKK